MLFKAFTIGRLALMCLRLHLPLKSSHGLFNARRMKINRALWLSSLAFAEPSQSASVPSTWLIRSCDSLREAATLLQLATFSPR